MPNLADGLGRFQRDVFPGKAGLFARLAGDHRPGALFIGCSDARVVPELITSAEAGELFVIRNAGNLVPPHTPGAASGVVASIEYALGVLGVSDIVVCGHSACGAMTALAEGQDLSGLPAVAGWLRHADAARAAVDPEITGAAAVSALVRHNVVAQLANLATHPAVARALARRTLTLHGWVYDIGSGRVEALDADGEFSTLAA
ncbi:carbonic anhydrase [Nocardia sp. NPDC005746]|uniref:carbonic anhydrase n=1 Tax=Nocardia sp. NPDC005746 TaxID=3157062 RepID=UPI0033D34ABB